MANVCDYVKWRGDLELKNDEFNEIDGLILSRLSYFPFEQLAEENEEIMTNELSSVATGQVTYAVRDTEIE